MNRRKFFFQTAAVVVAGTTASSVVMSKVKTKFAIDKFSVERVIENFDPQHPLIPWSRLGPGDKVLYGGLHVWWNPWLEQFGLWAEDTRQLFVIAESKRVRAAEPKTFRCSQCYRLFEDTTDQKQCLVGGHWTPHSEADVPPVGFSCCHQFQQLIEETKS